MRKKLLKKEISKITKEIQKEFPEDSALQEVHIARKIIAKEAEMAGMSYIKYIQSWKEKLERKARDKNNISDNGT